MVRYRSTSGFETLQRLRYLFDGRRCRKSTWLTINNDLIKIDPIIAPTIHEPTTAREQSNMQPHVDQEQIKKFNALAEEWWKPNGKFRTLHDINPLRVQYIADRVNPKGLTVLDIGCGGGILAESLAQLGAKVTASDPAEKPLAVARIHAAKSGFGEVIRYLQSTAEELVEQHTQPFDITVAFEVMEHVPDYSETVQALADLTRPGGHVFVTGINRTPYAYALMVLAGEYLLNVLPRGTHEYEKFMKPSELAQALRKAGLLLKDIRGFAYNPFTRKTRLISRPDVNYFIYSRKP